MRTLDGGIVVVGGGQAGAQIIDSVRQYGYTGELTLVSEERALPYQRPPLSKQYLAGDKTPEWLLYRPCQFYLGRRVRTVLGRRATAIDRPRRVVKLDDGSELRYKRLALATGCRPRRLPVPGADAPGVFCLRTLSDVDRIRACLDTTRRIVIIGGGFIGLEVAAVLVQRALDVTILEAANRVLSRAVAPAVAAFFTDQHARRGVRILTDVHVESIMDEDRTLRVVCADGSRHDADLIIAGVGVEPNVELARGTGLRCDDGIVVDDCARTSDAAIVAAGDCTLHPDALLDRMVRLETVHNAVEQAKCAAASLAGLNRPYRQAPWVWSDQYDLRLQVVGSLDAHDEEVLRGDPREGRFSLFHFADGRLRAAQCVNRPGDFAASRRILNESIPLTPAQAADTALDLRQLVPSRSGLEFDSPWVH